jgi:hypothetical protein
LSAFVLLIGPIGGDFSRWKQRAVQTWVGMMVGSKLASTAASHLLPLAVSADLNGSPLVTDASQALFQV